MKRIGLQILIVLSLALLTACSHSIAPLPPKISTDSLDTTSVLGIEQARNTVLKSPASADAWGQLGKHLDAVDYRTEAIACYERAAQLDTKSPRWLYLLGVLQLQNQPNIAISNLTHAVELTPATNDAPRVRLARALVEQGRFSEATNHLQLLLRNDPNHPAARLELGRICFAQNDHSSVSEVLAPCLTNPFTAQPAILLLSQSLARRGQTSNAIALAQRASTLPRAADWPDPFKREVQNLRPIRQQLADQAGSFLARGRLIEAGEAITNLLQTFPQDPEGLLLSGRLFLQQKNYKEAEQRFREHLQGTPDSLNGLIQLGLALLYQQRWNEAAETLERAVTLKPDFAQAHANLALARSRRGDSGGAINSYREALRCRPGDAATHAALAEELARAGQPDAALEEARLALELDPQLDRAKTLRSRLLAP